MYEMGRCFESDNMYYGYVPALDVDHLCPDIAKVKKVRHVLGALVGRAIHQHVPDELLRLAPLSFLLLSLLGGGISRTLYP